MHPALSLVLFTTLSGTGFGLMVWSGIGLGPSGRGVAWALIVLCALLVGGGLGASALHLRRPDRAWRAFSQWRSSWLSREAALAVFTSGLFGLYALIWAFTGMRLLPLGIAAACLALVTVHATAMIYAQLRTVPRWATRWTPAVFLAFALAGGAMLLATVSALADGNAFAPAAIAFAALAVAWLVKIGWWRRADRTRLADAGASPEAATGLGPIGTVRQFEPPHTGENYLLREMVFRVGRHRARALRRVAVVSGGLVPAVLLAAALAGGPASALLPPSIVVFLVGIIAERWLFFAEAEHAVAAYYR